MKIMTIPKSSKIRQIVTESMRVTRTVHPDNEETENDEEEEELMATTLDKRTTEITQEERGMQSINNYLIKVFMYIHIDFLERFSEGVCNIESI